MLVALVMPEKGKIEPWPLNACYQPLPVLTCQNDLSQLLLLVSLSVTLQRPYGFAHFLTYLPDILGSFSGLCLYAFNLPFFMLCAQVFFMTFVMVFSKSAFILFRFHENHYSHASLSLKIPGFFDK